MRSTLLVTLSALAGLVATLPLGLGSAQADGRSNRPDVMGVKDIKPGMKGYGLTVFEGTKPERFDVEVIDVLHNFRPRQELILVKTKHPRLEVAKVVAGMSGSPIFVNGKMIGAYAYGWTFGAEPVAGVTPIRNMIDDMMVPLPDVINGWPLKALPKPGSKQRQARLSTQNRFRGDPGRYDVLAHAKQLGKHRGSATSPIAPVATPVLMGGMAPESMALARELMSPLGLEPLQAGGGGRVEKNAPTRYENGSAIGVQLIRGDVSAMGLGTVTRVEGDRLVAFGHPMMQAGVTALPTAVGRVLWFLASDMRSFKIGMPVRPLGAMVNDRMASIVISHKAKAPVIPTTLVIKGVAGEKVSKWEFEVAHEKFMTPAFMAVALGNALQAVAAERRDVSWTAKSTLNVEGQGKLILEDFGVAMGGTPDPREFAGSNLVQAIGSLLNNPWKPVVVTSAEMEIELRYAREILRLRGADLLDSEIEAGQPAKIRLTLEPYGGGRITRVVSVPIGAHLAGQEVKLNITPGYTEERESADPENVADLLDNLQNPVYPPKSVVISYENGDGAVSFKGHVVKNLPPGALDSIRPTTSSVAPEAFGSEVRHVVPLPEYLVGTDSVTVKVKPVLR